MKNTKNIICVDIKFSLDHWHYNPNIFYNILKYFFGRNNKTWVGTTQLAKCGTTWLLILGRHHKINVSVENYISPLFSQFHYRSEVDSCFICSVIFWHISLDFTEGLAQNTLPSIKNKAFQETTLDFTPL